MSLHRALGVIGRGKVLMITVLASALLLPAAPAAAWEKLPANGTPGCQYKWQPPILNNNPLSGYRVSAGSTLRCDPLYDFDLARVVLQVKRGGIWQTVESKSKRKTSWWHKSPLIATVSTYCDPNGGEHLLRATHVWQRHDASGNTRTFRKLTGGQPFPCDPGGGAMNATGFHAQWQAGLAHG
jgi:hypothetical protein